MLNYKLSGHTNEEMDLKQKLTEVLTELLSIPSVTKAEGELADHLVNLVRREVPHLPCRRLANNLVFGKVDAHKPNLALVGHLDTVPPALDMQAELKLREGARALGAPARLPVQQEGDKLIGLGASDMKGGLAIMQLLLLNLPLAELPYNLLFIFYEQEEGPYIHNGLQVILDELPELKDIRLAIVMEPTDNTLQLGCLGSLHADLFFQGKRAHVARPWQGDNALYKAADVLVKLRNLPYREVVKGGLTFTEVISPTAIEAGITTNVIPDKVKLHVNYRFAPKDASSLQKEVVLQEFRQLLQLDDEPQLVASYEVTDFSPPGLVPENHPLVARLQRLGDLAVLPKQAWTDVARLSLYGIPAVNFGPGMSALAHQAGEWISLTEMVKSYNLLARFLTTTD